MYTVKFSLTEEKKLKSSERFSKFFQQTILGGGGWFYWKLILCISVPFNTVRPEVSRHVKLKWLCMRAMRAAICSIHSLRSPSHGAKNKKGANMEYSLIWSFVAVENNKGHKYPDTTQVNVRGIHNVYTSIFELEIKSRNTLHVGRKYADFENACVI